MGGQNPVFLSKSSGKSETEEGSGRHSTNIFSFLKWIAAVLFLLSLAAMASAGLLYGDLLALRERVQPETWLAYMEADGPPQAAYIGFAVLTALSLAAVAGIVYLFSAVSDAILRERRDR